MRKVVDVPFLIEKLYSMEFGSNKDDFSCFNFKFMLGFEPNVYNPS